MDQAQWFAERLTELRMERGVSARDMSLSLGQSESYINKIENKKKIVNNRNIIDKYKILQKYSIISTVLLIISLIINFI